MPFLPNILFLIIILLNFSVYSIPVPENKKATYDIWRKNKIIGKHEILFSENNGNLIIETNIDVQGSCNAYYDGTINFYAEGNGCNATAKFLMLCIMSMVME